MAVESPSLEILRLDTQNGHSSEPPVLVDTALSTGSWIRLLKNIFYWFGL